MKKLGNKEGYVFEISNIVSPIIICTSIETAKIRENLKILNTFEKEKRRCGHK